MTKVIESRLTYIKRTVGGKHAKALYRCVCGVEKEIGEYPVKIGQTISCGCYHKEQTIKHRLYKHPLYSNWANIKDRCYNENSKRYYTAGAKGIKMCDEWVNDFKAFYDWCMANGWRRGLQIDKDIIPRKLGISALMYSPIMCSIVTNKENNNVKSNSRFIEYKGTVKTITAWSEEYKISVALLNDRLKGSNKITDEKMFRPPRHKAPKGFKNKI